MSPIAVGGPELFLGTEASYVALARPEIDPTQPGVVHAAQEAGVSPEEFAGTGDTWAVMYDGDFDEDDEGGFELPGARDVEADDFAERLQQALAAGEPFTVEAGNFLRLDGRPAGAAWVITAHVTPPEEGAAARTLELGALPAAELQAGLETFRGSLA
ncbi:hypothetical protein ACF059_28450 [Streptomyces sp. NPDC016562]|uniref:hypothetical protein n=1 Tax=Streptomyces sp. NPDC016562 TaxID=3364966 RepID=UPI0036F82816